MIRAFHGLGMVLAGGAAAVCGLFLLGGAAPAARVNTTLLPSASSDSSTSTSTSTTSTTEPPLSPVPGSVTASTSLVGAGGAVEFVGTCQQRAGQSLSPVIVWVIAAQTERIDTGLTATEWTYRWIAPTDPSEFASYTFQFWCGDPSGWEGGYPSELQRSVDMVAQAGPPPTTTPPGDIPVIAKTIPETH